MVQQDTQDDRHVVERIEEQSIACLACGAAERLDETSPRLPPGKWPAWEPGIQDFGCPKCGAEMVWATEPYDQKVGPA